MKARMQGLLGLLSMVVEHVRAANERAARAEGRAEAMVGMLDALVEENAGLNRDLQQVESAHGEALQTIARLNARLEESIRLADAIEAHAADAELRIHRAAEALGLVPPPETPSAAAEPANSPIALH